MYNVIAYARSHLILIAYARSHSLLIAYARNHSLLIVYARSHSLLIAYARSHSLLIAYARSHVRLSIGFRGLNSGMSLHDFHYMGLAARKSVFGVSEEVRLKAEAPSTFSP